MLKADIVSIRQFLLDDWQTDLWNGGLFFVSNWFNNVIVQKNGLFPSKGADH